MAEFFHMGGYAAYIWPAFGAGAVILTTLLVVSLKGLKTDERRLRALQADMPSRRNRNKDVVEEDKAEENEA